MRAALFVCGLFLLGFALPALPLQQEAPASPPPRPVQEPLKSRSELLVVQASVEDPAGNFRGDLTQPQFRVLDDGAEQKIAIFDSIESPAHIAVLIETSPALYLIQSQHLAAAYALLDGLAPDDQIALATYDQSARLVLDFTSDRPAITRALDNLQYFLGMGDLNFYDAVNSTVAWLPAGIEKKAVVLLSTGLDTSTQERWNELQRRLESSDATVFTVGLGGSVRNYKPKKSAQNHQPTFERANQALREIARITGGRSYFPSLPDDFVSAYREISAQLRHQYLLAYPLPAHDGRMHSIEVRILSDRGKVLGATGPVSGLRVFARQSYLAPAN
ncbi:MAG TPA: VWA domain-containing protein [Candidatus Acidoferrales bacterium]|nr:VWA domain-containing protein [Candidatus Acidoferrales bacterium]